MSILRELLNEDVVERLIRLEAQPSMGVISAKISQLSLCNSVHHVSFSLCHYVHFLLCSFCIMCLFHYVSFPLCVLFIMCLFHYVSFPLCVLFIMFILHYVSFPLCVFSIMCPFHYVHFALCVFLFHYVSFSLCSYVYMCLFHLCIITSRCAVNGITVQKMANWHWCIGTLQRIVSDLAICDDGRMIEVDVADAYQVQLELVYRELVCVEINVPQGTRTNHLVLAAIDGSQPTHH